MELEIRTRMVKDLLAKTGKENPDLTSLIGWKGDKVKISISVNKMTRKELETLRSMVLAQLERNEDRGHNIWLKNKLSTYFSLVDTEVDSSTIVKRIDGLAIALKKYIAAECPRRWLFKETSDGQVLPYFVTEIEFHKRRRDRDGDVIPAYVHLKAAAVNRGKEANLLVQWRETDFTAQPVSRFLKQEEIYIENEKHVKIYEKALEKFQQLQNLCGVQMYASGVGELIGKGRWGGYSYHNVEMVREGSMTKVVVDPQSPECGGEESQGNATKVTRFWEEVPNTNGFSVTSREKDGDEDDEEDDSEPSISVEVALPQHPYVGVFDLDKRNWVVIHSEYLQKYPFDKSMIDKLVLPKDQKDLIHILMSSTERSVDDIVKGKMSGTIVMSTGAPGTGKTLTAEVFSEYIEKPLYLVQCADLGLVPSDIEENLGNILARAARWGAVLLIDEADVYVRARGEDIVQNAIVGVFLRLLEYYRGVLFMTSNMGENIDDAIMSRATAWLKYELPSSDLLLNIWKVLSAQYSVTLAKEEYVELINAFPKLSGRSVRNILKLATKLKPAAEVELEDLKICAKYQKI